MGNGASVPGSREEALALGFTEEQIRDYLSTKEDDKSATSPPKSTAASKAPTSVVVIDVSAEENGETARTRNKQRLHYSPPPSPEGPPPWVEGWVGDLTDVDMSQNIPPLPPSSQDAVSVEELDTVEKKWSWFKDTDYLEDGRFSGTPDCTKDECGANTNTASQENEPVDEQKLRLKAVEALSQIHRMKAAEVYEMIANAFMRHFQSLGPIAMVNFVDDDRRWLCNLPDQDGPHCVKKEPQEMGSFCQRCMNVFTESKGEAVIYVSDVASNPRFMNEDIVAGPPNWAWYCGAVIHIPNPEDPGKGPVPLGTVCLLETAGADGGPPKRQKLSEYEAKLLARFAQDASLLLGLRCARRTLTRVHAQVFEEEPELESELNIVHEE